MLLCLGPSVLRLCDRSVFRAPRFPAGLSSAAVLTEAAGQESPHRASRQGSSMDFDSTLGVPGEGPQVYLLGTVTHVIFDL